MTDPVQAEIGAHLAQALAERGKLKEQAGKLRYALENMTKTLQIIVKSPCCVTVNLAAFQRQVDGAQA